MKILLDEDIPHNLRLALALHDVTTVVYAGWSGLKNGTLLKTAEQNGFAVLITADKNLIYQQNIRSRQISIILVTVQKWSTLREFIPQIEAALGNVTPSSFQIVDCG